MQGERATWYGGALVAIVLIGVLTWWKKAQHDAAMAVQPSGAAQLVKGVANAVAGTGGKVVGTIAGGAGKAGKGIVSAPVNIAKGVLGGGGPFISVFTGGGSQ